MGYVSVSLNSNPELIDQSNREGIIESQAFVDLKEYIILLLNEIEIRRYAERPRENEIEQHRENVFQRFSLQGITQYIQENVPNNKADPGSCSKKGH